MDMYEDGALKDQKLNKKHLISTPEFKQHLLQPLHNLQVQFQATILQKVIDEEISLKELKDEAVQFRALETVKRAFIRCTNSQSWGDTTQKFPAFTAEDRLAQFMKLDFRHSIPEAFKAFCQSALNSQIPARGNVKQLGGVRVALVHGDLSTISAQEVKEVDPAYTGAHLILANVPKVCACIINPDLVYQVCDVCLLVL